MFDFSGYEKESPFYDDENKKLIGKMKDELKKEIIEKFVGLKEKIYSLKTKKEGMKKLKGAKKSVVKKDISRQDFVHCLKKDLCIPCIHINSAPSDRIKFPLALMMINDTCWMMWSALCYLTNLVWCKYLRNLSIIFNYFFRNF